MNESYIESVSEKQKQDMLASALAVFWTLYGNDMREGWTLTDGEGSPRGPVQIQRIDDPESLFEGEPYLSNDEDAWRIVATGTGPHHEMARRIVRLYNPAEWALLVKWGASADR